jgi:hypothetical protein
MKRFHWVLLALAGLGWTAGAASAQVSFFVNNQAGFNAAVSGRTAIGTETFEQSTIGPDDAQSANDPLTQGVANTTFPTGLIQPLTIQSNLNGANPATTNPRGTDGLAVFGPFPFFGVPTKVVYSNFDVDSTDYIFSITGVSAVGFNPANVFAAGTMTVTVFNAANVQIGQTTVPSNPEQTNHFGVLTTDGSAIGRINLFITGEFEGADNIALFATTSAIPEPTTLALAGVAGTGVLYWSRRRRRVIVKAE